VKKSARHDHRGGVVDGDDRTVIAIV